MSKKAILFDLDGTLTDSGEGIMNCALLALEHFGIDVPDRDALRVFVGPPLHETFIKFGVPEDKVNEAVKIYRSRYIPIGKYENHPYPGIRALLEKLQNAGHQLYVATSKPEEMSIDILTKFGLAHYFTRICGASLDTSRNSKDAVIAYLLKECGLSDEIVMIGDTVFDVVGAAAHKIPCIGVSWGYGDVDEMVNAGAAAIVHSTDELYHLLQSTIH